MQTEIRVISKIHPTLQQARFSAHEFLQNDMFKNALNIFSNFVTATMKIPIFIIIIFFHPRPAARETTGCLFIWPKIQTGYGEFRFSVRLESGGQKCWGTLLISVKLSTLFSRPKKC